MIAYKLIPPFIKRTVHKKVRMSKVIVENNIPRISLEEKHLALTKVLTNRYQLLELMPKNGIIAEIGVDKGDFSERILEITQPKKLHLIDLWGSRRYNDEKFLNVSKKFKYEIEDDVVRINRGLSVDVIKEFDKHYFDWVYIDSDHSYKVTANELGLCKDKVKLGGIIAGHDFTVGNWIDGVRYGVIEAVYEFCVKENWQLLYLTSEVDHYRSFAIKRIRT